MFKDILLYELLFIIVAYLIYRLVERQIYRPYYYQKKALFDLFPAQAGDIVFLGDSITDFGPWEEFFPDLPVKNRGISADKIKGVYHRLDNVIKGKPAKIFLLIGTNDVPFFVFHSDSYILTWYQKIADRIRTESPETELYIQSIFPRARPFNKRIVRLNARLAELAEKNGATYVDLYSRLVEDDHLKHAYSNDQLHLMPAGYQVWIETISPYIRRQD